MSKSGETTMPKFGDGPTNAKIMLVGEAFGYEEERAGTPFVGASGQELNRMLHEVGIMRSECYVTNLVNSRPPNNDISAWIVEKKKDITALHVPLRDKYVLPIVRDGYARLLKEIELVNPNIIVCFGNVPMWALTGAWGILKWRGSQLNTDGKRKLIPTIHPASVLRQWSQRALVINDLKRVKKEFETKEYSNVPYWRFQLRPNFNTVMSTLETLFDETELRPLWLDLDLETRAGHIACCGLSWTRTDAISIPFMCVENREGYWTVEEEAAIIHAIYKLTTHPNCHIRWQNGLYDAQYIYRWWHFVPNQNTHASQDTMISHHTLFAGLPKRLDFQASMYCDYYVYWKDDGKTWDKNVSEDQLWSYNCVDCVRTREVGEVELQTLEALNLTGVDTFQQSMFWPVLQAMQRGVRIDEKVRAEFALELQEEMSKREDFFQQVLGHPFNPRSPVQMQKFFYEDLQIRPVMSRPKKGAPSHVTCDDDALEIIMQREPIVRPFIHAIQEYRSLGVFLSTFVLAKLDYDKRMRCSYNICGTETYRLSSSKNPFESGTNLQNIPKGNEDEEDALRLPNVRKLFVPDPGMTFFDMDLDRADLQVVVWEADDAELKAALRLGVDMHLLNAYTLAGKELPPLEELVESHERYLDHRIPYKKERQLAKSFIHGTNYGGGARTMAIAAGVTVHQADRFQKIYFGRYPGLKDWHNRTEKQLTTHRFVSNAFGYRRYYFDRTDGLLPEALAWIPQSTVGIIINKAWKNIYDKLPEVQVLLQVHDSLAGQLPTHKKANLIPQIKANSQIIVPYPDPLIVPVGIKTSEVSWGACA
jgi:DNA polymerase I-like protein with 3'-5' exonuclease and polymerase domains/uracil-DNA glycosylase